MNTHSTSPAGSRSSFPPSEAGGTGVSRLLDRNGRAIGGAPYLILPTSRSLKPGESWEGWLDRAKRPGGYFYEGVRKEKALYKDRATKLAVRHKDFRQNNRSEFRKRAVIDSTTALRWMQEDPHFFDDDKNLDRLIKDNPEMKPWEDTPSRYVHGCRFSKGEHKQ